VAVREAVKEEGREGEREEVKVEEKGEEKEEEEAEYEEKGEAVETAGDSD
jgi:hypothetical protein